MRYPLLFLMMLVWLAACNRRSTVGSLFAGLSPHERYEQSLRRAALDQTALGTSWLRAAESSLRDTLTVTLPFREVGYFVAERPRATAFRYAVRAGQRIRVAVRTSSSASFFLDVFRVSTDTTLEAIASADSTLRLSYDAERDGVHHLRLQPELLQDASYELTVETAPSLGFPVAGHNSRAVGSFYGAPRDGGARSHRGVDIFAPRGTPVVAASAGVVSARTSSRRGGKVVWLKSRDMNQYYAHLDSQAVRPAQRVRAGDTLGWVGNTGNARTTPPHLHFGVYRFGQGAVDPFPFIDNTAPEFPVVATDTALLKRPARVSAPAANLRAAPTTRSAVVGTYGQHTLLYLLGTTGKWFRVALLSGQRGYVHQSLVGSAEKAVAQVVVPRAAQWYWTVDEAASDENVFLSDLVGVAVPVLARYDSLLWVEAAPGLRMWLPEPA